MQGLIALFVVIFFAGMIFQKEVSVNGASSFSVHQNSVSGVNDSMAAAYGDACVLLAQSQSSGFVGQFTNSQVLAASPQPLPGVMFTPGWSCEIQNGTMGTRDIVAVFPGVSSGTDGNLMYDLSNDGTYWTISALSMPGAGQYAISSATNLASAQTYSINPSLTIASSNLSVGSLMRWEVVD